MSLFVAGKADAGATNHDRRWLLGIATTMILLIVATSLLAPAATDDDPRPLTTNVGPHGAKATFVMLGELGYRVASWQGSAADLDRLDAPRSTLVVAQPYLDTAHDMEFQQFDEAVHRFLERGGRVLAVGGGAMSVLPGAAVKMPSRVPGLCQTTPEGLDALARAGSVAMEEPLQWSFDDDPHKAIQQQVAQRCGGDAVVVHYPAGHGEAIWWAAATPLTNANLEQPGAERLLLASLGLTGSGAQAGRALYFVEDGPAPPVTLWQYAHRLGLPLRWVELQAALLGLLVVLSFSRRHGPVRSPLVRPRSSPVEFAESMGDLYARGHATSAATEAVRRRLLRVLEREAGLPRAVVAVGPEEIVAALQARFGAATEWQRLGTHLQAALDAQHQGISAGSALALVRALSEDAERVVAASRSVATGVAAVAKESV